MFGNRVKYLLEHHLGLAAYHLPLDKHAKIGNNACLLRSLQASDVRPFAGYHGVQIGYAGRLTPQPLSEIVQSLETFCGCRAQVLAFGPQTVQAVGVFSGAAYSMLPQAIEQKLDLYVTGILDEPAYEWCREGKINCIALGHYHSEKCGIRALSELTATRFPVDVEFIETENPL